MARTRVTSRRIANWRSTDQYALRPDEYLDALERLARLEPSEETLRQLSDIYSFRGQVEAQITVLQQVIRLYPGQASDLLALAHLQAAHGGLSAAASTLERFHDDHPEAATSATMQFFISILLDSRQTAKAMERAGAWLLVHQDPEVAVRYASLASLKGQPKEALLLLEPFAKSTPRRPDVLDELIRLEIANGRQDDALARLERLHAAKQLPLSGLEPLLDLLLTQQRATTAIEVASQYDLGRLPSWLLANLADAALAHGRADFAHHMLTNLGERFLEDDPILGARVALAQGDPAGAQRWVSRAVQRPLSHRERLGLAQVYAALGRRAEATAVLLALSREPETPDAAILDLANLYLLGNDSIEGFGAVDALRRSGRRSPAIDARWALLALRAGHIIEAAQWLASADSGKAPLNALEDIYFGATDAGAHPIAAAVAGRLFARLGDRTSRQRLAAALVAARQPLEALPHLRALVPGSAEIESLYVEALRRAWADGAPVRAELTRFWSAKLSNTGVRDAARAEILHALIDLQEFETVLPSLVQLARHDDAWLFAYMDGSIRTGRKPELVKFLQSELDRLDLTWTKRTARLHLLREHGGDEAALPYLRQFAEVQGGDWLAAFEEALQKLNRSDDLLAFWKSRVRRRDVALDVKRGIAARSLAAGQKPLAESILLELSANAPSDSPDVLQLLYAWGPNPTDAQLDWVEARARASSAVDRTQWMQHLLNAGAPQRAVDVAQGAYSEVYLRALVAAGRGETLSRAIVERVAYVSDPNQLRFLARLALEGSQPAAMRAAYEKLLTADPDDGEALKQVGALDYVESRFSPARARLGRYIANGGGDYATHFSFAEILARDGEHARARAHFERSLAEIARFEQPTLHMRTMQALGLHRVGRAADAFAAFEALLGEYPENDHLRADYVGALLQSTRYAEAALVLGAVAAAPPPTAPEQRDGRLRVRVLSAQLLQAEARSGPAAAKLRLLLAEHPGYVPALLGLAQVERERGRWRIADALLQRVLGVDPVNEDARRTRAELRGTHGGHLQLHTEWLQIAGGQRERRSRVSADDLIAGGVRVGTIVEQNEMALAGRRHTRERAELFLQAESEGGLELMTSGFATRGALGGGLRIGHTDGARRTYVQADIKRPYWEAVEAVVGHATRDRVEVHRDDRLGQRISLGLTGAMNRYRSGGATR